MTAGWLRRHRAVLVIVVVVSAAVALLVVTGRADDRGTDPLDPGNPAPGGGQAVARVLADSGVEVEVARGADALDEIALDAGTTVVVTSVDSLGESSTDRLVGQLGGADLVLVDATTMLLDQLAVPLAASQAASAATVDADCDDPLVTDLSIAVTSPTAYTPEGSTVATDGCFPIGGGALLRRPRDGLILLGAGDLLANQDITRADNAAVAVRLLGQDQRLVWYVPDLADLQGEDAVTLTALLPRWLLPGLWLGALAMVAVLLWRGRRLGALVTEPLPVVVKAIETTRSRGRLYRKARDRGHAAEVLRAASRTRIADRLRLPRSVSMGDPDALARDTAQHSRRSPDEVRTLLAPSTTPPSDDPALIRLATDLAELEREVRR